MESDDFYRHRAMRRLAIVATALVVAGGGFFLAARAGFFREVSVIEDSASRLAGSEFSKPFSAPPPLVGSSTAPSAPAGGRGSEKYALTRAGVIADTNAARAQNGSTSPLAESAVLDAIASFRLNDMFANQYFAHFSPASSSAESVAAAIGYNYLALGENLALGNFNGDGDVVMAWMNSPGHRANILDANYTQIGVAVGEGNFQGNDVWIAVQVFGKPLSDCPTPDATLKTQAAADQAQAQTMANQLQATRAQIDAMDPQSSGYAAAASSYNSQVTQYNVFSAQAKSETDQYNKEVSSYNQCVSS